MKTKALKMMVVTGALLALLGCRADYRDAVLNQTQKAPVTATFTSKSASEKKRMLSSVVDAFVFHYDTLPERGEIFQMVSNRLQASAKLEDAVSYSEILSKLVRRSDASKPVARHVGIADNIYDITRKWNYSGQDVARLIELLDSEPKSTVKQPENYLDAVKLLDEKMMKPSPANLKDLDAIMRAVTNECPTSLLPVQVASESVRVFNEFKTYKFMKADDFLNMIVQLKKYSTQTQNLNSTVTAMLSFSGIVEAEQLGPYNSGKFLEICYRKLKHAPAIDEYPVFISSIAKLCSQELITLPEISGFAESALQSNQCSNLTELYKEIQDHYKRREIKPTFADERVETRLGLEELVQNAKPVTIRDLAENSHLYESKFVRVDGVVADITQLSIHPNYKTVLFQLVVDYDKVSCTVPFVDDKTLLSLMRKLSFSKENGAKLAAIGEYSGGPTGALYTKAVVADETLRFYTERQREKK